MVLMLEQPERVLTPLSTPEVIKPAKKDARTLQSNGTDTGNGEDRQRRVGRSPGDSSFLAAIDTPESDMSDSKRKPPLLRFKAVEQTSPLQSPSEGELKLERKKSQQSSQFSKANAQYHKIFKEISKDEILKQSYTCALQKDMLYQGRLFVSDSWICFHSKVFGRDTKIAIPAFSVTLIKKTKTAILVPNAIVITTTTERHVFVSFLSRDTTYKTLKSVCIHLDGDNIGCSPTTSSAENSFRTDLSPSLPLDFSADFSDLDGVVRQRRQDMLESSSSGSQTPDYDKMAEFHSLPENFLKVGKDGEVSVHADVHLQTPPSCQGAQQPNGSIKPSPGDATPHDKPTPTTMMPTLLQPPLSLHTLLLIYMFLVLVLVVSSCYMAFKIVVLEQKLNSLGSVSDHPFNENAVFHSNSEVNAQIYGELSTNLFKLEKIQRNLRKLLEET